MESKLITTRYCLDKETEKGYIAGCDPINEDAKVMFYQVEGSMTNLPDCTITTSNMSPDELLQLFVNQPIQVMEKFDYKKAAEDLWQLLDDIDTSTDIFKPSIDRPNSLMTFYNQTNKYTAKRFDILKSDGYKLYTPEEFDNLPKIKEEWKNLD